MYLVICDNMCVSFYTWITQYAFCNHKRNEDIYIYVQYIYICFFLLQSRQETFFLVSFNPSWSELVEPSAQVQPGQPGLKDPWFFSGWDRNNLGCSPRRVNVYARLLDYWWLHSTELNLADIVSTHFSRQQLLDNAFFFGLPLNDH